MCEGRYNFKKTTQNVENTSIQSQDAEKVSAIYVTMKIETVTIAPIIYNEQIEDVGMGHISAKVVPETIMTQSVSYSATYHGTNIIERGYDMRMVTVNTGFGKEVPNTASRHEKETEKMPTWKAQLTAKGGSPWYEHVGMIVFDIGNGIPVQYIIKSGENCPNNTVFTYAPSSDVSSEVIFSALIRGLRNVVVKDKESLANGFMSTVSETHKKTIMIGIQKNQPRILNEQKKISL
jgi:hypothetical protein